MKTLEKRADLLDAGLTALSSILEKVRVAALVAPAAVGASAGAGMSMITSPTKTDVSNLQDAVYEAELEETLAYMQRQKALAAKEAHVNKGNKREREIHI